MVAGIAAWSSYSHMVHVALRFGERPEVAWLVPFSVDGMLVVASVAMVDDKRSGGRVRPMVRVAFAAGVAASIAANIAAAQPTWEARIVAAWPALALLLVVEMLSRSDRADPATAPAAEAVAEPAAAPEPTARVPEPRRPPHPSPEIPASDTAEIPAIVAELVPPQRTNSHAPNGIRRPAVVTRQLAADILAAEPGITRKEIAARLGLSTRRLREVLASVATTNEPWLHQDDHGPDPSRSDLKLSQVTVCNGEDKMLTA